MDASDAPLFSFGSGALTSQGIMRPRHDSSAPLSSFGSGILATPEIKQLRRDSGQSGQSGRSSGSGPSDGIPAFSMVMSDRQGDAAATPARDSGGTFMYRAVVKQPRWCVIRS